MDVVHHHQTQFSISIPNSSTLTSTNLLNNNNNNLTGTTTTTTILEGGGINNGIQQHSSSTTSSITSSFDTISDERYYNSSNIFNTFNQDINENNFNHGIDTVSSAINNDKQQYMGYPIDTNTPCISMIPTNVNYLPEQSIHVKEESDISYKENQSQSLIESIQPSTSDQIHNYQQCFGCHDNILDKWLFVINNTHWHSYCLRCSSCNVNMNDNNTCFWRDNHLYCRHCYQNQYIDAKCASCHRTIGSKDWVRRAREFVYHLACFACSHCKRQLSTGEEFSINDNRLLCKQHYMELIHGHCKTKTKRVRTTFAEEQLSVLQAHFQIDSNPDGADLEKIANITGLSKRVTQVWFQNSRARQKKYQGHKKPRTGSGSERCGSTMTSGRSSVTTSPLGSPNGSCEGMIFPTSVTTSAEEAINSMDSKQLENLCYDQ